MAYLPLVPTGFRNESREVSRFAQVVGSLLNSFVRAGVLHLDGASGAWGLTNLFYAGVGPPAAALGYQGSFYLDLTSLELYEKE